MSKYVVKLAPEYRVMACSIREYQHIDIYRVDSVFDDVISEFSEEIVKLDRIWFPDSSSFYKVIERIHSADVIEYEDGVSNETITELSRF